MARAADCHPDKPHYAKGMCRPCYDKVSRPRWVAANRDRHNELGRRWAKAHPEKIAARVSRWQKANPERVKEHSRRWREANPEKAREADRRWAEANPDLVRDKARRRRAAKASVPSAPFRATDIYERDGWRCQLCSEPVDPALLWPNTGSASLDHITPISLGGPDTPENAQLAHLGCNSRKGNRVAA